MSLKPVIIDFATLFDPARLISVLASVDIRYSEVWVPLAYDHLKEKDFLTGFGTDSVLGLLPNEKGAYKAAPTDPIAPSDKLDFTNIYTGPRILQWGILSGRIVPKDFEQYEKDSYELAREYGLGGVREDIMLGEPDGKMAGVRHPSLEGHTQGLEWRLSPYGLGSGFGQMLLAKNMHGAEPFFSHPFFFDQSQTLNNNYYLHTQASKARLGNPSKSKSLALETSTRLAETLIRAPEGVSLEDVSFFLDNRDRIECLHGIIRASEVVQGRPKDCGIIASKFLVTTGIDLVLFGGLPISSAAVSLYDIGARFCKKTE